MRTHWRHGRRACAADIWFESFKRQGFYFPYAAMITILTGVYVHMTRLFLGSRWQ